jgi:hypothetical protein
VLVRAIVGGRGAGVLEPSKARPPPTHLTRHPHPHPNPSLIPPKRNDAPELVVRIIDTCPCTQVLPDGEPRLRGP